MANGTPSTVADRAMRVRYEVPLANGTANYHVRRAGRAHAKRFPITGIGTKKKSEIQW